MVWGPVTAKATHPKSAKLLYKWSNPHVVVKKVSRLLYKVASYKTFKTKPGQLIVKGPFHVNRLHPYTPLSDGSPSVQCNPDRPRARWSRPERKAKVNDVVIICVNSEWEDTPFAVCKVLNTRIATALRPRSYVVQWYGSYASRIRGPYFQGWVDSKDNKVVYTSRSRDYDEGLRPLRAHT